MKTTADQSGRALQLRGSACKKDVLVNRKPNLTQSYLIRKHSFNGEVDDRVSLQTSEVKVVDFQNVVLNMPFYSNTRFGAAGYT